MLLSPPASAAACVRCPFLHARTNARTNERTQTVVNQVSPRLLNRPALPLPNCSHLIPVEVSVLNLSHLDQVSHHRDPQHYPTLHVYASGADAMAAREDSPRNHGSNGEDRSQFSPTIGVLVARRHPSSSVLFLLAACSASTLRIGDVVCCMQESGFFEQGGCSSTTCCSVFVSMRHPLSSSG